MKKRINEELYDIYYDYEDEEGYIYRDNKEEFEGDWLELQDYINSMRRNGCYNIDAVYREGSSGEYDYELEEDIADNDIEKVYKKLSKLNGVDFGKLEDEYLRTRPSVGDAVFKFYGTVLNMNYYCKDFVNWVKEEKGIDLKGIPCKKNEELKEDTVKQGSYWVNKGKEGTHGKFRTKKDTDAQRRAMYAAMYAQVFKEGLKEGKEKINQERAYEFCVEQAEAHKHWEVIDFLRYGDEFVKSKSDVPKKVNGKKVVYMFSSFTPFGSIEFWLPGGRRSDFEHAYVVMPREWSDDANESLKEGMNKKDIAKRLVQLAYDYDYYDFMDSLEVGETMEDAIIRTERDLDNPKYVRGIIRWLKEVANDEYIKGDDISQKAKRLIKELRGER